MATSTSKSSKAQAVAAKATAPAPKAFKGTFGLIPPTAEVWACEGTGEGKAPHKAGAKLPRRSFPTTTGPERRTAECRSCRNFRQGRAEKEAAKVLEAAKATAAAKRASKATAAAPSKRAGRRSAKAGSATAAA